MVLAEWSTTSNGLRQSRRFHRARTAGRAPTNRRAGRQRWHATTERPTCWRVTGRRQFLYVGTLRGRMQRIASAASSRSGSFHSVKPHMSRRAPNSRYSVLHCNARCNVRHGERARSWGGGAERHGDRRPRDACRGGAHETIATVQSAWHARSSDIREPGRRDARVSRASRGAPCLRDFVDAHGPHRAHCARELDVRGRLVTKW